MGKKPPKSVLSGRINTGLKEALANYADKNRGITLSELLDEICHEYAKAREIRYKASAIPKKKPLKRG